MKKSSYTAAAVTILGAGIGLAEGESSVAAVKKPYKVRYNIEILKADSAEPPNLLPTPTSSALVTEWIDPGLVGDESTSYPNPQSYVVGDEQVLLERWVPATNNLPEYSIVDPVSITDGWSSLDPSVSVWLVVVEYYVEWPTY